MLRITAALFCCILVAAVVAGCGEPEKTTEETTTATTAVPTSEGTTPVTATTPVTEAVPESVTITDASGREMTMDLPLKRVCYIHPTIAEGLRIIDAWDRVAAVDEYTVDTVLFPNIGEMPVINYGTAGLDYEAVIELQPDALLVRAGAIDIDVEQAISALEPEIPVIAVFDTSDPDTWEEGAILLGTIMQKEAEAQEFIGFIQQIEDNLRTRTAGLSDEEKPTVFIKTSGYTLDEYNTLTDEFGMVGRMIEVTGAVNVAADLPSMAGYVQAVDVEWVMEQDYDYIIVQVWDALNPGSVGFAVQDTSVIAGIREEHLNLDAFAGSQAVENGNVYLMDLFFQSTPRHYIVMEYVAKVFHPELFTDLDPRATLQEYLDRFIRIDFDLDESGVFFYPEP
jgi:iron complex transport system substrate-binding protein